MCSANGDGESLQEVLKPHVCTIETGGKQYEVQGDYLNVEKLNAAEGGQWKSIKHWLLANRQLNLQAPMLMLGYASC